MKSIPCSQKSDAGSWLAPCVCLLVAAALAALPAAAPAQAPTAAPTAASQPASQPSGKAAPAYTAWPFDAQEAVKRQDETAKALGIPKETALNLGGGVTMKFILIPAGKFMMGSPKAQHEVTIAKPYYMAIYKVTQAQYEPIMDKNPSAAKGKDFPVNQVTWQDAEEFCQKAAKKTGKKVRLPTPEQWENACRAGADTKFFWGDDEGKLGDYAWYRENMGGQMHAVGQKKPNNWGLYDISGLMWEYCGPAEYDPAKHDMKDHVCRGATWGRRPPMFVMGVTFPATKEANDRYGMRVIMDAE